jgi:hypothetical protein
MFPCVGKKTEQINVAVTQALFDRASRLERKTGIKPTEMGRIGLVEVLNRLDVGLPPQPAISAEEAHAVQELRALGLDPLIILRNALSEVDRDVALSADARETAALAGVHQP